MKTYHFLAGLPRSGNTLLSSLLNQNPLIHSSALSPVSSYLFNIESLNISDETASLFTNKKSQYSVLNNIINNFYSEQTEPIIIDRNKSWGTIPNFFYIQQHITPEPKIIFTVRPIIEILTSFIALADNDPWLDNLMKSNNWVNKSYLTQNDNRCDYLMSAGGQIDTILGTINQIMNPEYKNNFCVIQYNEIVNTPNNAMEKIYEFLGLPNYKHNFNNIIKLEKEDFSTTHLPNNLHDIRPKLSKVSKKPEDVLSDYVLSKYSNIGWGAL
jgi:sulfotransferase